MGLRRHGCSGVRPPLGSKAVAPMGCPSPGTMLEEEALGEVSPSLGSPSWGQETWSPLLHSQGLSFLASQWELRTLGPVCRGNGRMELGLGGQPHLPTEAIFPGALVSRQYSGSVEGEKWSKCHATCATGRTFPLMPSLGAAEGRDPGGSRPREVTGDGPHTAGSASGDPARVVAPSQGSSLPPPASATPMQALWSQMRMGQ